MLRTVLGTSYDVEMEKAAEAHFGGDETEYCKYCHRAIDPIEENYELDGDYYCERCQDVMRDLLNDFIAEILGRHVGDEALDAIMADCEMSGMNHNP